MPPQEPSPLVEAVKGARLFKYDRITKLTKVWYGGEIIYEFTDEGRIVGTHAVPDDANAVYDFMRFDRW